MHDKGDVESASFVRTIDCDGSTLAIKQFYVGTVGCVVWDAALVLCRFLENRAHFGPEYWAGKRVLELGSGTGAVGLAAAVLGYQYFTSTFMRALNAKFNLLWTTIVF